MQRRILTLLIFLGLSVPDPVFSQKNYSVTHYNGDNGLPQNSIKGITSDSEGFIWLGTEDGLARFDGSRFYLFNKQNLGVSDARVSSIHRGRTGQRKPGSTGNRINYAYFNTECVRIENGVARLDTGYHNRRIKSINKVRPGKNVVFEAEGLPSAYAKLYPLNHYMLLAGENDDDFYLCEPGRVSYYESWKKQNTVAFEVPGLWNFFTMGNWLYYLHDNQTISGILHNKQMEMPLLGDILKYPGFEKRKQPMQLFWNHIAGQAFIYLDKNLYILDQRKDGRLLTRLLVEDFDLVQTNIEKVYFDSVQQKIYLGSGTDGLYILTRHQFETLMVAGEHKNNVFYGQTPYDDYSVLTSGGRLIGKDSLRGKIVSELVPAFAGVQVVDQRVLVRDRKNTIWMMLGSEVVRLDRKNEKIIDRWSFFNQLESIHRGREGTLLASVIGKGLYEIDPQYAASRAKLLVKGPLPANMTRLMFLNSNTILLGTTKGLYKIDIRSGNIKIVPGTDELHIKSIHTFDKEHVWFTALEKGLILLTPKQELVFFPLDKNRYLSSPHCVVNDGRGYFWLTTNKGLFQMAIKDLLYYAESRLGKEPDRPSGQYPADDQDDLFYMYHTKDEGFNTNEFNGSCEPCAAKLGNGYISLPSLKGLVWFRPEKIINRGPAGSIILDKAEVGRKPVAVRGDTIFFPLNPRQVRLYLSTVNFGDNYNLNLSYALIKENTVAISSDWIPVSNTEPNILFSSLNSGKYTLLIKKRSGFGIGNYTIKKIHLVVPPMWYETWLFRVLLVVVLLAVIYCYSKLKIRSVQRENVRLEQLVEKRTERLNTALIELEESKNEMGRQVHMLSRLLTSMTHDVQSPLNYIALTSAGIRKMIEQGSLSDVSDLGDLISDSSHRISVMLRDLLDYIKVQVYGNRMKFEDIELSALVENKLQIFKSVINNNGSHFKNEIPAGLQVFSDYQMLSIMIHNLIDNAAKFTVNGSICARTQVHEDGKVELIISNSATGVPEELLELINMTEEKEPAVTDKPVRRAGLGLLIVKEISTLIGVNLRVTETDMTRFHLYFE